MSIDNLENHNKTALIYNISDDFEKDYITLLKNSNELVYKIDTLVKGGKTLTHFRDTLKKYKVDYLYILGHGDGRKLFEKDVENGFNENWETIADVICETDCLNKNATLMLYCCNGGLDMVAHKIFERCLNINTIFGCITLVFLEELFIGFNVFIHQTKYCEKDTSYASDSSTKAAMTSFQCLTRESYDNFYKL